jgi:hypothetical protein
LPEEADKGVTLEKDVDEILQGSQPGDQQTEGKGEQ